MVNIKNITKKLVDAGYSEEKLILMTEKEIRETYKSYKSSPKEDDSILSSPNTTPGNNDNTISVEKEESTMTANNTTNNVTINNNTNIKEETIMKTRTTQELINDALNITKIQDKNYVTNAMLREEYKKLTGNVIGSKKTRPVIIKAIQDAIGEIKVICENRFDDAGNINTTEKRFANAVEAEKYALEAAEYNSVISVRIVDGENISIVKPESESVSVGDLSITSDRIYHDDTIIKKAVPVAKVNNPTPDDAKALTYRLMHKIGDHALSNRKKGFGTTVSAWMLCAYILEVKYDIKKLKGHEHEITDEMKTTVKNVRKWLIDNHYIETVTFKDEKGFVFYTPEYDGNRQSSMYDATKFQSTGKTETTTYRITKEMNKWYTK